jgi:hypothetical protein
VVVAEQLGAEISQPLQNLAIRTGRLYFLTQFTYAPSIGFFDLIICSYLLMQASASSSE